jgi:hypothetical protein
MNLKYADASRTKQSDAERSPQDQEVGPHRVISLGTDVIEATPRTFTQGRAVIERSPHTVSRGMASIEQRPHTFTLGCDVIEPTMQEG